MSNSQMDLRTSVFSCILLKIRLNRTMLDGSMESKVAELADRLSVMVMQSKTNDLSRDVMNLKLQRLHKMN